MFKNRPLLLVLAPLLALGLLTAALAGMTAPAGAAPPATQWDDALRHAVEDAGPGEFLSVIAHLPQQHDPDAMELPGGRVARATLLIEALRSLADETQHDLLADLETLAENGRVRNIRPLWIVNGIAFDATPGALEAVGRRSDVARLTLDEAFSLPEVDPDAPPVLAPPETTPEIDVVGAPAAWHALGITGAGVTVALMDSGVDWTHPVLSDGYRGRQNGVVTHAGHWYDVSNPASGAPFDPIGHGTHVAGLAVGRQGIGVAPGAQWIAVKISNNQGQIFASYVLDAYQWLLAPAGDPALAPDVVNGSWGNSNGSTSTYAAAVAALRAAGIIQVYSAGNNGPQPGTVGAPASYAETIAVGALDPENDVAWFSSRGPSPLTPDLKPLLSAPGTRVLSSWPGGEYRRLTGTSMSAPMVAGATALALAADSSLDEAAVAAILSETSGALTGARPNSNSGWGVLDAYRAVARALAGDGAASPGAVSIAATDEGAPVSHVAVTVTTPAGSPLHFTTDGRGNLNLPLRAGTYQIAAGRFGYAPTAARPVSVSAGLTTSLSITLEPLPSGTIRGQVVNGSDQSPAPFVKVEIDGVPRQVFADGDGRFQVTVPAGTYSLRTLSAGSSIVSRTVDVRPGATTTVALAVASIPRILLVDGGGFLFAETGRYFETALRDNGLGYTRWSLDDPYFGHPPAELLASFDAVVWSAPQSGPELGNSSYANVLYDYLENGGKLLVSGQSVGGSSGTGIPQSTWWTELLGARYVRSTSPPARLVGAQDTPFAALSLSFDGGDGAGNQLRTEVVEIRPGKLTVPLFSSEAGNVAGLHAGVCEPFEIIYFGFGLEGVAQRAQRAALIEGAFDYFTAPPPAAGVRVSRAPVDDFVLPGSLYTTTLPILNLGEVTTDTFEVTVDGARWPTTVTTPTLTLGPCRAAETELQVQVPHSVDAAPTQQLTVTIRSQNDATIAVTYAVNLQTPHKPILLVDDDRFYHAEETYQETLTELGAQHDTWTIGWDNERRGSPTADFLSAYDVVLWVTGYDWYQPLSPAETESVVDYLQQGGRFFLSSQDYLYYNENRRLTHAYFNVAAYTESLTATLSLGVGPLAGVQSEVTYSPYQNNSDGIFPEDPADVQLWGNRGLPVGVQQSGAGWRTVFWAVPLEKLDDEGRRAALGGILRQLTDIGASTWEVDRPVGPDPGRTYTLTLRNDGSVPRVLAITNTVPASLTVDGTSVNGGNYDPDAGRVTWSGPIPPGTVHVVTYRADVGGTPAGIPLENPVTIADRDYGWTTTTTARTRLYGPDLTPSHLALSVDHLPPAGQHFTATLVVHNDSPAAASRVTATLALPWPLQPITGTLHATAPGVEMGRDGPRWTGALSAGEVVTLTINVQAAATTDHGYVPATAYIKASSTGVLLRPVWIEVLPHIRWLPVIDLGG